MGSGSDDYVSIGGKMDTMAVKNEEMLKCQICDVYFKKGEGFTCPKCKRGPLCKNHRVPGKKECASCLIDMQMQKLNSLKNTEAGISSFTKLLHFVFLIFSIFFISLKLGLADYVEFLQNSIITDSLIYIGGASVIGYIIFYFFLYNQRSQIREIESQIRKAEIRRHA